MAKKPQINLLVSWLTYKPDTCQIQVNSVSVKPTCPVNDDAVVNNDRYQNEGYVFFMHCHTGPESDYAINWMIKNGAYEK
jgi:hypothetical protein